MIECPKCEAELRRPNCFGCCGFCGNPLTEEAKIVVAREEAEDEKEDDR